MAYEAVKAQIDAYIKANGVNLITGPVLNAVLTAMLDSLGEGYAFQGVLNTTDIPSPAADIPQAWLASAGTYLGGSITVDEGELALITHTADGWSKVTVYTGNTGDIPQPSDAGPLRDGEASAGTSDDYARGDHRHPTDTSRAPVDHPEFTGRVLINDYEPVEISATGITRGGQEFIFPDNPGQLATKDETPFLATYGSTPYNDIYTAIYAGRQVFAVYGNYRYQLEEARAGAAFKFTRTDEGGTVHYVTVGTNNVWSNGSVSLAPKASPALTGTPTAPTAPKGTNTTQIATTAFVQKAVEEAGSDIDTVQVTVDNNTGTPSATGSVSGSTLSLAFHNLKGAQGPKGDTGETGATGPQGEQGPAGPQGPQGNPGSSVDYPFELVNNLKQGGVDKALTAEQGKDIGIVLYGLDEPEATSPTMKQGFYNAYTGIYAISSTRICTSDGVRVMGAFKVEVASGYKYNILYYDVNQTFIEAESTVWLTDPTGKNYFDGYIQLNVAKADDSGITPAAATGLTVTRDASEGGIVDNVASLMTDVYGEGSGEETTTSMALEQGGMLSDGKKQTDTQLTRARTRAPIRVYGDFTIALNTGYQMNVFFYSSADLSSFERSLGAWVDTTYVGNYNGYIMIGVKAANNGNVTPSAVGATLTQAVYVPGLKDKVEELAFDPNGYYYGADLIKHPLRVKSLGSLSYLQAFCVYNGKYYSTNGSNIAEQDENFSQLRSASISAGHGNSLQLGHNGKAYASGWNDQKVYVIDLATLSVETTITLPTTGYTTAAIDDIRGYAYIFQRDSYPTTVAAYNFIVYDYVNQQVISRRVLDEPFSAMQSCDYVEGKIIVAYGGGTTAMPSGVRTYNTSGDVLAVYSIDAIATVEPEGVAFDRDDWRLLLSDVNKNVMQIYV